MGRRTLLAALLPLLIALVTADAFAQTPRRGGVLRIADREAPNLDPHASVSFLTHSWASMVYSQLVRFPYGPEQKHPADFSIVPDLAEKWEYKNPTSVVFTPRKGVKFHNKPPVKRLAIIRDIQRYLADKAYYVDVPTSPQYITHPPHVKGMKYHDGFGLGPRLMFTWLEK